MRTVSTAAAALAALLASATARAGTRTAASCSASDVQAAIAASGDGDTVRVPADACTWTSRVTFSKAIRLEGHGATITFGTGGGLDIHAKSGASAVVTGFTFQNGFASGALPVSVSTSDAPFNAPFRVYDNTFEDDGQQGGPVTFLGVAGFGPGLIDHNTFKTTNGADEMIHLLGSGTPSDASGWSNDVEPGGPNMTFLENNVFVCTNPTYAAQAEESYYGAQFAFRSNHLTFAANDIHQGGLSGRWAEIYDNTYQVNSGAPNPTNALSGYWQFRGGSGVVFGNISSGSPCCQDPYPGAQFGPDCPSSDQCTGAWPIPTQVGTGIHQSTNSPIYVWANDGAIDGSTQSVQDGIGYTNGTQAGATPTSCTHPGSVCDVVATNNAPATWVRCESAADVAAGCPVSYTYQPYPYPHPHDDLSPSCFGAGCKAVPPDGGTGTNGGASPAGSGGSGAAGGSSGSRSGSSGASGSGGEGGSGSGSGCGCVSPPGSPNRSGLALLAMAGALSAIRRRRRVV